MTFSTPEVPGQLSDGTSNLPMHPYTSNLSSLERDSPDLGVVNVFLAWNIVDCSLDEAGIHRWAANLVLSIETSLAPSKGVNSITRED